MAMDPPLGHTVDAKGLAESSTECCVFDKMCHRLRVPCSAQSAWKRLSDYPATFFAAVNVSALALTILPVLVFVLGIRPGWQTPRGRVVSCGATVLSGLYAMVALRVWRLGPGYLVSHTVSQANDSTAASAVASTLGASLFISVTVLQVTLGIMHSICDVQQVPFQNQLTFLVVYCLGMVWTSLFVLLTCILPSELAPRSTRPWRACANVSLRCLRPAAQRFLWRRKYIAHS